MDERLPRRYRPFLLPQAASLQKSTGLFAFRSRPRNDKKRTESFSFNDSLVIEVNKFAAEILDKYKDCDFGEYALPRISNQKMNHNLKMLCELCEFYEPITIIQYLNGTRHEFTYPKWQVVSTHTGRKSFICNALAAGIPVHVVMKWTGHSDYKAMKPYIEVAEKTKAAAMDQFTNMFE